MHPMEECRSHETATAHAQLHKTGYARGGAIKDTVKSGVHQHERALHRGEKETDLHLRSGGHVKGGHAKARADRRARGGRAAHRDDGGSVGDSTAKMRPAVRALQNEMGRGNLSDNVKQLGARPTNAEFNIIKNATPSLEDMPEKRGGAVKRARGGRTKGSGKINIIIATGGGEGERQMAMKQGAQMGAALASAGPKPPMMPPPGMGAPPGVGGPPGMPPHPPMAGPPGAPPPGMPPMKRGGRTKTDEGWPESGPRREYDTVRAQSPKHARGGRLGQLSGDAGAGGAKGRLEKEGMVSVRGHQRRRAGGRV